MNAFEFLAGQQSPSIVSVVEKFARKLYDLPITSSGAVALISFLRPSVFQGVQEAGPPSSDYLCDI